MPEKPKIPAPDDETEKRIGPDGAKIGGEDVLDKTFDNVEVSNYSGNDDLPASDLSKYERDARRLLGLDIEWAPLTDEEKTRLLASQERMAAYDNIDTTTHPRDPRIREKQGIVSEVARQNLLSVDLLRTLPTVYLGSGDDVDYPLALGARKIELVDPIFDDPEAVSSLEKRLGHILQKEIKLNKDGTVAVPFDFGDGQEVVTIKVTPELYYQRSMNFKKPDKVYKLPKKIGLVILFASQGPGGQIEQDEKIESRIVKGGAILNHRTLVKYPEGPRGERQIIQLGKEEK